MDTKELLPYERLIVALDLPSENEARELYHKHLSNIVSRVKIGLELFTAAGPGFVRELAKVASVMLDLKLHDIPETVSRAIKAAGDLGVEMVTLHISGGIRMMETAARTAQVYPHLKLLGVTVLTSHTEQELHRMGQMHPNVTIEDRVIHYARLAEEAGLHGVVASPLEAKVLRLNLHSPEFLIITPGIRPAGTDMNDQARATTPSAAIQAGASMLVVGRPITRAQDPSAAVREIVCEIFEASSVPVPVSSS